MDSQLLNLLGAGSVTGAVVGYLVALRQCEKLDNAPDRLSKPRK